MQLQNEEMLISILNCVSETLWTIHNTTPLPQISRLITETYKNNNKNDDSVNI